MSSKLVKKLLQQTCTDLGEDKEPNRWEKVKLSKPLSSSPDVPALTKEEALQRHVQSILRLDTLVNKYSSKAAQNSFSRHTSNMEEKDKTKKQVAKTKSSIGNSRSSCSAFTSLPKEKTFNKIIEKKKSGGSIFSGCSKGIKKGEKEEQARLTRTRREELHSVRILPLGV
mmetsp:Transcript_14434/g.29402  ORF Transcript_14434/g.29402 Transcript_14434/m.29402 type:complete len:170 (+) Transcript_14434:234-743(+)